MNLYSSDQDFAAVLLRTSNCIERCTSSRSLAGRNNKADQLNQMHRAMHHRSWQAEY
jgi:hypothetical protein